MKQLLLLFVDSEEVGKGASLPRLKEKAGSRDVVAFEEVVVVREDILLGAGAADNEVYSMGVVVMRGCGEVVLYTICWSKVFSQLFSAHCV